MARSCGVVPETNAALQVNAAHMNSSFTLFTDVTSIGSQPGAFFGEPQGLCASRSRYAAKILYISEKFMTHA